MNTVNIILIILSILLVASIIVQNRGTGVSGVFGGGGESYRTKRGAEKGLYYITIVLAILFFGVALYGTLFI